MTVTRCDRCGKEFDPKTDVHFRVNRHGKAIQDGDQVTRNADLLFNQLGALVQSIEASGWSGNSTLIQQSQDLLDTLTVAETLDK